MGSRSSVFPKTLGRPRCADCKRACTTFIASLPAVCIMVRSGMGRFESTQSIDVPELEHSVVTLPWGVLRGAFGPSDGSMGASSNVPSAISVLRHAALYLKVPEELSEAFDVLVLDASRFGVVLSGRVLGCAVPVRFRTSWLAGRGGARVLGDQV